MVGLVILLVVAIIGLFQGRKVGHERLQEAVKDLMEANKAQKEKNAFLEETVTDQKDRLLQVTQDMMRLRGRRDRLLRENHLLREYRDILIRALRKNRCEVPAEPPMDEVEV